MKKRIVTIILAVISLAFFVISYLLPERIGEIDYTGVYTDAGIYSEHDPVEVKKVGGIYVLLIKPSTGKDEYVNVEFSPDRPGELLQIDDYSRCRVYMFNNSMCIQTYERYEQGYYDETTGEYIYSNYSDDYEAYGSSYMVKTDATTQYLDN